MSLRQIHILTSDYFRIFEDFHRFARNLQNMRTKLFFYCFWTILWVARLKLFRNNNKNNSALNFCKFLANLCKYLEVLEQCHVKWWLNYWNNRAVSSRLSKLYRLSKFVYMVNDQCLYPKSFGGDSFMTKTRLPEAINSQWSTVASIIEYNPYIKLLFT